MFIIIGVIIVLGATLGGFILAGGNPVLLLHISEFVVLGGITLGVVIISTPPKILKALIQQIKGAFGPGVSSDEYLDMMKYLYELFILGRRNGLIALDEHVSEPEKSPIFSKYPSFLKHKERVEFLCNGLRPLIDGKIKPDQLQDLLSIETKSMKSEAEAPGHVLHLVADSLPGIGIVAAVLGIINTMAAISAGPEAVGEKVAAALTGTFLGIFGAYGFVSPLAQRIHTLEEGELLYFEVMSKALSGFAKGLAPIMAIEVARRTLGKEVKVSSDELESMLKSLTAASSS